MRINLKLTDKQAKELANKVYDSNFRVYGIGNFDVDCEEFADILKIAFNENKAIEKLDKYFNKISPMG